jgi:hypothetical protein
MSFDKINPEQQSITPGQAEAVASACPSCGTDVRVTGFVVFTAAYQAYVRNVREQGAMVKGQKDKSETRVAHCTLCRATLLQPIDELIDGKKEEKAA